MDLSSFRLQISALTEMVLGLSNMAEADDHLMGLYQGQLLAVLDHATAAGCSKPELLVGARAITQLLVELAKRDDLTLSHEMDRLVSEYDSTGQPVTRLLPLARSKPLAAFPKEPPVVHTLFVDEAGSPSFAEEDQPVLCLIGVLVEDRRIDEFDWPTTVLLERHGIPGKTEIHAYPVLTGEYPFNALTAADRDSLLMAFLEVGLNQVVGLHYLS